MRGLLIVCLLACGRVSFTPLADGGGAGDGDADSQTTPACQTFSPWSTPIEVTTVNSTGDDWEPSLRPDGSVLVFARGFTNGLFVATRTGPMTFTTPTALSGTAGRDNGPTWSPSGDRLYFSSERLGQLNLWAMDYVDGVFMAPFQIPELAGELLLGPAIRSDDLEMYYNDEVPGAEVFRAERATPQSAWTRTGLQPQLTIGDTGWPTLSRDGLTMYLESIDAQGPKIYVTTRASTADQFGAATYVSELVVGASNQIGDPDLSPDGLTLVSSMQLIAPTTGFDIYMSTRSCLD